MKITMRSPLTGRENTMDIAVTDDQLREWRTSGKLIQNVFPHLSLVEREFLMTGYTPEDWERMFPEGPEGEPDFDLTDLEELDDDIEDFDDDLDDEEPGLPI